MPTPAPPVAPVLPLDVPFIPDVEYMRFLAGISKYLHSIHVPLHLPGVADARPPTPGEDVSLITRLLAPLRKAGVKCYGLLNSRFYAPETYTDETILGALGDRLRAMAETGVLQGIIYVDHYLLQALSDAFPNLCSRLEAVPSVNCRLDSLSKVLRQLKFIELTTFAQPDKLVLDRSLNRRREQLAELCLELRVLRPNLRLTLLANEGCLDHCPFQDSHSGHMSLSHIQGYNAAHMDANKKLGCSRLFFKRPDLLLSSPFIRPEDQIHYAEIADIIKLCGRSRGPKTMRFIISAYLAGNYAGNLLWLNDSQEPLAHRLFLPNNQLPVDFVELVGDCQGDCERCGICRILARRHITLQPPGIDIKPHPRQFADAACAG